MNAEHLEDFYDQLLEMGLERDIRSYNDGPLDTPEDVWQEIRSEAFSAGFDAYRMDRFQLLQTYNRLAGEGKVSGLGGLMK